MDCESQKGLLSPPVDLQHDCKGDLEENLSKIYFGLQDEILPNPRTEKERECWQRMKKFVETFVTEVEAIFRAKYLVLEGELNSEDLRDAHKKGIAELVGSEAGVILGELLGMSESGKTLGAIIGQKIDETIHKKKLLHLAPLVYYVEENRSHAGVTKILVECGFQIFRNFEKQIMGVTSAAIWNLAVKKLAQDAVHRAINFCAEESAKEVSVDAMTRGVVEGKSKKGHLYSPKRGLSIKYHGLNVTTEDIYTKPGLVTLDSNGFAEHYYRKLDGKCNTSKFGHRVPFNWEHDDSGNIGRVIDNIYQREGKPQNEYEYSIKPKYIDLMLKELFNDIRSHEPLTEGRMREVITSIIDGKVDEILKIKLKQEETSKSVEDYCDNSFISQSNHNFAALVRDNALTFDLREPVPFFTGRSEDLKKLHKYLYDEENGKMVIVCGEAGVGKSELVRMYTAKYSFNYSNIVWINAENFDTMKNSFLRLAMKLGILTEEATLGKGSECSITDVVGDVYKKLLVNPSLLIFDYTEQFINENEEDSGIDNFLPTESANTLHIIITSHHFDWDTSIPTIQLDQLSRLEMKNITNFSG